MIRVVVDKTTGDVILPVLTATSVGGCARAGLG